VLEEMAFVASGTGDVYVSPRLAGFPQRDLVKVIDETKWALGAPAHADAG